MPQIYINYVFSEYSTECLVNEKSCLSNNESYKTAEIDRISGSSYQLLSCKFCQKKMVKINIKLHKKRIIIYQNVTQSLCKICLYIPGVVAQASGSEYYHIAYFYFYQKLKENNLKEHTIMMAVKQCYIHSYRDIALLYILMGQNHDCSFP